MRRPTLAALLLLTALAAAHLLFVPRTIWEYDESFFALGVENYEPRLHHPPPPGYPVYMAFAKVVNLVTDDAFDALRTTSVIGLLAGIVIFVLAFRRLTGSTVAAAYGTAFLFASPALLVSGTLPQSDAGAIALLGLAILACAQGSPTTMGIACAAAIGWRPQLSIAVLPLFATATLMLPTWKERFRSVLFFGYTAVAWFVPLVLMAGGPEGFWKVISGQAAYYAQHDADLSRSGYSPEAIALRFIAHPWGPKWLAIPLLAVAASGITLHFLKAKTDEETAVSRWKWLPLLVGSAVYLAFALATMDPMDAVRYAIPSLPVVALFAGVAVARFPLARPLVLLYAAGAIWYASPLLIERSRNASPPAAAATWLRSNAPKNSVVLYDLPLGPHASYLLRGFQTMRLDAGMQKFGFDTTVPLFVYADGERAGLQGQTFRWSDTDAYRKLTRQHYGAVSVIPFPPEQRFRVVSGVYAPERRRDGLAWRWLDRTAVIELPPLPGRSHVEVTLRFPVEAPIGSNRVRVRSGEAVVDVTVPRNTVRAVTLPLASDRRVRFESAAGYVPAKVPGSNNRDARSLAIKLLRVEQGVARAGG